MLFLLFIYYVSCFNDIIITNKENDVYQDLEKIRPFVKKE